MPKIVTINNEVCFATMGHKVFYLLDSPLEEAQAVKKKYKIIYYRDFDEFLKYFTSITKKGKVFKLWTERR